MVRQVKRVIVSERHPASMSVVILLTPAAIRHIAGLCLGISSIAWLTMFCKRTPRNDLTTRFGSPILSYTSTPLESHRTRVTFLQSKKKHYIANMIAYKNMCGDITMVNSINCIEIFPSPLGKEFHFQLDIPLRPEPS